MNRSPPSVNGSMRSGGSSMELNEICDTAHDYAKRQGFYEQMSLGEKLMLIVSEVSEAMEAMRTRQILGRHGVEPYIIKRLLEVPPERVDFEKFKGSFAEELADIIIRVCDLAGYYKIDLDWFVRAKMAYNETRPYKHGKAF